MDQPYVYRRMLLAGLCISEQDKTVLSFLSAFGITDRELLSHLALSFNQSPARLTEAKDIILEAVEAAKKSLEPGTDEFTHTGLLGAVSELVEGVLREAYEAAGKQGATQVQPVHILAALVNSDADEPGWIGWLLGKDKVEWIRKTLREWSPSEPITEEAVKARALEAGLFAPPSASSDAAAKDDLLGFERSAKAMASIILKPDTVPPLVVGVYGPWGSGKSTYMQLVKQELEKQYELMEAREGKKGSSNLIAVEYDAWAYSDAPKLWAGLIAKIAKRLDQDLGFVGRMKYLFERHRRQFIAAVLLGLIPIVVALPIALFSDVKEFVGVSTWNQPLVKFLSAAIGIFSSVLAFVAQKQAVFKNVISLAAKFDSAPASGVINSIQGEFRDAVESWINQKTGAADKGDDIETRIRKHNLKIVVFIDELDRCPLERIVDILEAIKLFLAKEIFIVFMAVDTRVASEAIRLHYKDVSNPDLPREYLEKIVQLPMCVPTANREALGNYLKKFMPNVESENGAGAKATDDAPPVSAPVDVGTARPVEPKQATPPRAPERVTADSGGEARPETKARARSKAKFTNPSPVFPLPQLPDTQAELEVIEKISEQLLESNPRRIKRLLNTYRYVKLLSHAQKEPVRSPDWQKTMIAWLAFTMRWPLFMAEAVEMISSLEAPEDKFLSKAISRVQTKVERPDEETVRRYLPVDDQQVKKLWGLAGNFLIENADPRSERQQKDEAGRSSDHPFDLLY
ncbi:MAG TPA: P-loop NTPase fold protein [Blastocatellia bacterium]|nr:P-loop NTPase fold protein [Blastocatellia bacterium]